MNTIETAKYTGIPAEVLIRMRARETRTLKNGPPFCKTIGKNGETVYVYWKKDVKQWMKMRRCLITAGDAALIMDIHREELLDIHGVTGIDIRRKKFKGKLIIDNPRNVYIWLPKAA